MLPRQRVFYYNGKKYNMPKKQLDTFFPIVEPTTELQSAILFHICLNGNADYGSTVNATNKDRITVLQGIKILSQRHLIYQEKLNPQRKKSKVIFKPTDRGILNVLGNSNPGQTRAIAEKIEHAQTLPNILTHYIKLVDEKKSNFSSTSDHIQEFSYYISCNDLFNENGFSLVNDIHDLWKHEVRMWMSEVVANKFFDIAELFGSRMRYKFENFLIPPNVPGLKETLIKIRKNLDECIKQLQD